MGNVDSGLRLFVLDNPYRCWRDAFTKELFLKTSTLKFEGYGKNYPAGILPVDTADWISTHYIVCRQDPTLGWTPLMGVRLCSVDRCREHFLGFPPLLLARSAAAYDHVRYIEQTMERCDRTGTTLTYTGSFTILPSIKNDNKMLFRYLFHLLPVLHYFYQNKNHENLGAAVVRFRMNEFFQSYGWQAMGEGRGLNLINSPYLAQEAVGYIHLQKMNSELIAAAKKYESLWAQRITIDENSIAIAEKKAA